MSGNEVHRIAIYIIHLMAIDLHRSIYGLPLYLGGKLTKHKVVFSKQHPFYMKYEVGVSANWSRDHSVLCRMNLTIPQFTL